jgi:ABC-type oligopeptide transport system substrate-binding subunit
VTAADLIYSWNRAASQGYWTTIFQSVAGYPAVASGKVGAQLGLSAPDPFTLVARLSAPSGYWLAELALPGSWVMDKNAIAQGGPRLWWTQPEYLVGTGPFRMTNWTAGAELDFAPVPNWWGGSTGTLARVELHITDSADAWHGYAAGRFDALGFGQASLAVTDTPKIDALLADPARRAEVHSWPYGITGAIGFNLQVGPFSGEETGKQLRTAFSQAIDRQKLAEAICHQGTICVAATGGLISKGLAGYLGDGRDPAARFDPAAARATVKRLDPGGSLLRGLAFYFPIRGWIDRRILLDKPAESLPCIASVGRPTTTIPRIGSTTFLVRHPRSTPLTTGRDSAR